MLHVAIGIVFNPQQKILIAKRALHKHQGGLWEFPGGKIEINETVFAALQRELQEEINITALVARPFFQTVYRYDDKEILLDTWLVSEFSGSAEGAEGQEICWVSLEELRQCEMPEANKIIIERL